MRSESSRRNVRTGLAVLLLVLTALYILFSFLAERSPKKIKHPDIDTEALASSYIEAFSGFTTAPTYSEEDISAHFASD